jgi:hypothetical protein
MTAEPSLTGRERALLDAIYQLLDLPPADGYDDRQRRKDQMIERSAYVRGAIQAIFEQCSISIATEVLTHHLADPLDYTPMTDSSAKQVLPSHG